MIQMYAFSGNMMVKSHYILWSILCQHVVFGYLFGKTINCKRVNYRLHGTVQN